MSVDRSLRSAVAPGPAAAARVGVGGVTPGVVPGCDATVRPARDDELAEILEIAMHSFPSPEGWATQPDNLTIYRPDFVRQARGGGLHVIVGEDSRSRLCGYCYYQIRESGDVYLVELAADPPAPARRVPRLGSRLLLQALEDGVNRGCSGEATLNITAAVASGRRDGKGRGMRRDPQGFYERFGYQLRSGVLGYRVAGVNPRPDSRWMTADLCQAFHRVSRYLASPRSVPRATVGAANTQQEESACRKKKARRRRHHHRPGAHQSDRRSSD